MKKKILFVHYGDDWVRGSEKCLLDLIKYMRNRSYEAFVWTNNRELSKQLELFNVPNELDSFPLLLGWKAPKYNVSSWLGLIDYGQELIEREEIDLVHINSGAPCQWMLAAARLKKVPLVTQLHCPYPARDRLTLGLHLSPHIISVSNYVAQSIVRDGYPTEKVSIIHNGIDTAALTAQEKVDVRQELNIPGQDFIFATVGSLIHRKGVDRIMTAMRHVVLEYPNVSLVVIGDGSMMDKLHHQAEYLHLAERIHFVGEQTNVVGWLKGCDAFISGARSEAFGLAVAEAVLAKIPVIAPFEGGIPEFISHGKTGVLYPNHGVGPIAKSMRILVNNPQLCSKLGLAGYEHITKHYDLSVSCRKIINVYRDLLEQPFVSERSIFSTFSPIKTYVANRLSLGGQHG
ncbi:glycosyltransferase family 4 protein [Vibrio bivalvicida]|uniref:Glycosyltransferase n=1 Tax=Vibrio bivalvicida TaxID=1276888 RepID=A0A177Y606_9VIBR|nr:glycosyltransferase family 4 protein [Vibrio bivalvicida]OAJ96289.1 glycosyltransferase [Vibrio bivalvicida]